MFKVKHIRLFYIFVAVTIVVLIAFTIPHHMDEFIQYHALACKQPPQKLNDYRLSCGGYQVNFLGLKYEQSYLYIGAISSVLMAPLHFVNASILNHYLLGVIALVIFVGGLRNSFKLQRGQLLTISLYFPITFAIIHDGGPVRIALMVFAWSPVIFRKFLVKGKSQILWAALLIALLVIALEDKPFFVFLIPGMLVFIAASLNVHGVLSLCRNEWKRCLALIGLVPILFASLLSITSVNGHSYIRTLAHEFKLEASSGSELGIASLLIGILHRIFIGLLFLIDWPLSAHRTTDFEKVSTVMDVPTLGGISRYVPIGSSTITVLAFFATIAVIFAVIVMFVKIIWGVAKRNENGIQPTYALLGVSLFILFLFIVLSGGWAVHHFVYVHVILITGLVLAIKPSNQNEFKSAFVTATLSLLTLIAIWLVPTQDKTSPEINELFAKATNLAQPGDVINCGSWGCYTLQSLMNVNNAPVTFADSIGHIDRLVESQSMESGRIFHLCSDCDLQSVQMEFKSESIDEIGSSTTGWNLYLIANK
jgi:hypothetical protein